MLRKKCSMYKTRLLVGYQKAKSRCDADDETPPPKGGDANKLQKASLPLQAAAASCESLSPNLCDFLFARIAKDFFAVGVESHAP